MNHHKKGWMVFLGSAVLAAAITGTSQAFVSKQKVTNTAEAALSGTGDVTMSLQIKKVSDDSTATQITWSGVTLPTRWKVADHYIQISAQITSVGGGIQTYTDNMATDASPKFTGDKTVTTPSGLIDTVDSTRKLTTAWSVRSSLTPITVNPANPDDKTVGSEGVLWLIHEDASQVAIAATNSAAFVNADPFIEVQTSDGIHFAQGPTQFGPPAAATSNYYLEADFGNAVTPRTYRTSKLVLESFNP